MNLKKIFIVFGIIIFVGACKKNDDNPVALEESKANENEIIIDASGKTEWVYFSFRENKIIKPATPETTLDWDIAFMRYHIKTNSGTSGKGKAGAKSLGKKDFMLVKELSEDSFIQDSVKIFKTHSGEEKISVNTVLEKWTSMQGMPPVFVPSDEIFAVKTAEGKYVKLHLKNYYNKEGKSGFITIKYSYQSNGTKF